MTANGAIAWKDEYDLLRMFLKHPFCKRYLIGKPGNLSIEVVFDSTHDGNNQRILTPFVGKSGLISFIHLIIDPLDNTGDDIIFAVVTDDGQFLNGESLNRLLALPVKTIMDHANTDTTSLLDRIVATRERLLQDKFLKSRIRKLNGWAGDVEDELDREIKDLIGKIVDSRRSSRKVLAPEEKRAGLEQVKDLESHIHAHRRAIFDADDDLDRRRDQLISEIEGMLQQGVKKDILFAVGWRLE